MIDRRRRPHTKFKVIRRKAAAALYRERDAREAFFRPKDHSYDTDSHADNTSKKKPRPRPRSLGAQERVVDARSHWERNHGDHKDLHNSHLDLPWSPEILDHHQQLLSHTNSENVTDEPGEDLWLQLTPLPNYINSSDSTTPTKLIGPT